MHAGQGVYGIFAGFPHGLFGGPLGRIDFDRKAHISLTNSDTLNHAQRHHVPILVWIEYAPQGAEYLILCDFTHSGNSC
jgi:hypothetical protein